MSKSNKELIEKDFTNNFANRLTELRLKKDVSAREMSLALGQSEGYINRIENCNMMPSVYVFVAICEYLEVSPGQFLNFCKFEDSKNKELIDAIQNLPKEIVVHLELLVNDLT